MKILVINCGSSSVKYQFINPDTEDLLASGIAEKIGEEISLFTYKTKNYQKKKVEAEIPDHETAIEMIIKHLTDKENGVIKDINEIDAVGHRLVHAGEYYSGAVKLNDDVVSVMKECISLAPLHNPANIEGIEAMQQVLPNVPQCGLFDTAFHQTMEPKAYLYAIPYEFYRKHKIRRYGFHGTSHKFVAMEAGKYLNKNWQDMKIITCHIGNGASITAIEYGKSVDTSMGFTPLEGLVMGTRCGDIDPAIPIHLIQQLGYSVSEVNTILNKKSGILGLSELSNDMRTIETEYLENKNPDAVRGLEVYAYRIRKYIGAYMATMNGCDVIVFTGGVGENMPILRELVLENLENLGIVLNKKENNQFKGGILDLTGENSKVKILKIPTNEELMIAKETERLLTS